MRELELRELELYEDALREMSVTWVQQREGKKQRKKSRKVRSDKKWRERVRITEQANQNLTILAHAFDVSKSRILSDIADGVLTDQTLLVRLLRKLNYPGASFRVVPSPGEKSLDLRLEEL